MARFGWSSLRGVFRQHWLTAVCLGMIGYILAVDLRQGLPSISRWDWLMNSGVIVFIGTLVVARDMPGHVARTIGRINLRSGNPDVTTETARSRLSDRLRAKQRRYARVLAPLAVVTMAICWLAAWDSSPWRNPFFWISLLATAIAGAIIGQFVANGRLGTLITDQGLLIDATPGHPDGAAGLQPVGKLYLRQATLIAVIGLYAGIWWLVIPQIDRYDNWRDPYLAIVVICLILEWASLFLPLYSFHALMVAARDGLLPVADSAALRVVEIDEELTRSTDPEESARLTAERAVKIKRFSDVEEMPTWPLTARIRRRFGWNNVFIIVPVFLQWVGAPEILGKLNDALSRIQ